MAVVSVTESGEGRRINYRRQGRKLVLELNRVFDIFTDYSGTAQLEVLCTSGLPKMNSSYLTPDEFISVVYARNISAQQDSDNPFRWRAEVEYSSDTEIELAGSNVGNNTGGGGGGGGQLAADPLKRRPVVNFGTRVRKGIAEEDYSTPPQSYTNSAGEKFDPPVEKDVFNLLITISKNTAEFDEATSWQYIDAVNELPFKIQRPKVKGVLPVCFPYPRRSMRIIKWDGIESEDNDVVYYQNNLEIEIQFPNWDQEILNQGTFSISNDGAHSRLTPIDGLGIPNNGKIMLDANGVALPNTVVAVAITANPAAQAVTPKSMLNIVVGIKLIIGVSQVLAGVTYEPEEVTVTAITATTFSAIFTRNHAANARVQGKPTFKTFKPFLILPFAGIPLLNPL